MLHLTARKYIKLARVCYQVVYLLEQLKCTDSEILQAAMASDIYGNLDIDQWSRESPDLYLIAGFYGASLGPTNCRMQEVHIKKMFAQEDLLAVSREFLALNQAIKSSLYKWLAINEKKRIVALAKIFRPDDLDHTPIEKAMALDIQARRLEFAWVDRSEIL